MKDDVGAEGGPPEVLTLGVDGDERVLPVFSFEEEAQFFLRLSGFKDGWRTSKSGAAGLASVLFDACPDARRVALDTIPEIGSCGPHDLVGASWEAYVGLLDAGR